MSRFGVAYGRSAVISLVACLACVLSASPCDGQPASPPDPNDILMPGGTAALLRAAGVGVPVDPPRTLLVLARNLYGPFAADPEGRTLAAVRTSLAEAAREHRAPERIPGLLPPEVWQAAVFRRAVAADGLAAAIILDRRASLLYYGLFSLDDETVGFFAAHPDLLTSVYRRWPELFAAFAEGLHIRGGRMIVAGGEAATEAWEQALGAPAADPVRFVTTLFERNAGRLVQLFGALGRLDPPHLAFALGPEGRDLPELIASAARFNPDIEPPFVSWSEVDVPFLLEHVKVNAEGRLAPPRARWFWEAAFGGQWWALAATPVQGEVTSPRLVDLFGAMPRPARRLRFDMLLFAQRRFADHWATGGRGADEEIWLEPVARFPAQQTLLLTLEQMRFVLPEDYRRATAAAGALETGFDPSRASRRVAVFQAMVSLIAQCQRAGSLAGSVAHGLVSDVFRMAAAGADDYGAAALDCLRVFVARLSASPSAGTAEARLLDGLAGTAVERPRPVVEWEGRQYTVDLARAERRRLEEVRARQGGRSVDDILELGRAVSDLLEGSTAPDRTRQAATGVLLAMGGDGSQGGGERLLGFRVDGALEDMRDAARAAGGPKWQRSESARKRLAAGLEVMLAEVLLAHAYALWLDPETPLIPGDGPDRRHDLGLRVAGDWGPWLIPRTVGDAAAVRGSLLGLDRCLAREALRSTMVGLPGRPPTLPSEDARGLAESVVALDPLTLTDEGARLIAGAVKRGRARLAASAGDRAALEDVLAAAGVDGARRRLARLEAPRGAPGILAQVSLSEVLAIGQDGAPIPEPVLSRWGVAARLVDGSLGQRMPGRLSCLERAGRPGGGLLAAHMADPQIRVAEWLSERRLPALLARGVLAMATWDLAMHAQVANHDDWLSVVRAAQSVTDQQFEDYVWAMAAGGALVPAGPSRN